METRLRRASSRSTFLASPRQPMPETTMEESRTATSFMPLQEFCSDLLDRAHDFFNRGRTICAISPVHLLELSFQSGQLLFALAPNQISNHVAGRGETALFSAGLNPCS